VADSLRYVFLLRQQLRFQWVRDTLAVAHGLHNIDSPCDGNSDMDVIVQRKHCMDRMIVGNRQKQIELKKGTDYEF